MRPLAAFKHGIHTIASLQGRLHSVCNKNILFALCKLQLLLSNTQLNWRLIPSRVPSKTISTLVNQDTSATQKTDFSQCHLSYSQVSRGTFCMDPFQLLFTYVDLFWFWQFVFFGVVFNSYMKTRDGITGYYNDKLITLGSL